MLLTSHYEQVRRLSRGSIAFDSTLMAVHRAQQQMKDLEKCLQRVNRDHLNPVGLNLLHPDENAFLFVCFHFLFSFSPRGDPDRVIDFDNIDSSNSSIIEIPEKGPATSLSLCDIFRPHSHIRRYPRRLFVILVCCIPPMPTAVLLPKAAFCEKHRVTRKLVKHHR